MLKILAKSLLVHERQLEALMEIRTGVNNRKSIAEKETESKDSKIASNKESETTINMPKRPEEVASCLFQWQGLLISK